MGCFSDWKIYKILRCPGGGVCIGGEISAYYLERERKRKKIVYASRTQIGIDGGNRHHAWPVLHN